MSCGERCGVVSGVPVEEIRSLGFDATCSLVALDEQGQGLAVSPGESPDHNIIMWMDHRAADETKRINATQDPALRYVGGEVSVEMELPKVLWLKNHFPATWQRAHRFYDLADFPGLESDRQRCSGSVHPDL